MAFLCLRSSSRALEEQSWGGIQRAGAALCSSHVDCLSWCRPGCRCVALEHDWSPFFDTGDLSHAKPKHLLWAFLCLRKYGDESEMAALCGASQVAVDEKTFRKWRTIFVKRIACLKYNVVSHLFMAVLSVIAIIYLASHHSFLSRSFGRTGRSVMWATTVSFQSTALMMPSLISKLPPMLGIPRSSMHMVAV